MKEFIEVTIITYGKRFGETVAQGDGLKAILNLHSIDMIVNAGALWGYCRIDYKGEKLFVKESYEELKEKLLG